MTTRVLEKGHVAIPGSIRRRLGIEVGDEVHAEIVNGGILLSPKPKTRLKGSRKARIVEDPELGLPVLDAGEDAPMLTNEIVREMLADFP